MNRIGQPIVSPGAWKGPEIDWTREGLHVLDADAAEGDRRRAAHLLSLGELDFPEINRRPFRSTASAS